MCNGNRVVARRMNLRADHPLLVTAILPHEVTHVVLADLFTEQQIPRWADEGLAVLAEPRAEQAIRAAELQEPLEAGQVFDLRKLMAMDYPDAKEWSLYYAQSVSLTRFLVEQGSPEKFVQFVQNSQRDGTEGALRGTYGIGGFTELQTKWTEYARQRLTPVKEASRDSGSQPVGIEVK
jgi:Peptidase MA superfamily